MLQKTLVIFFVSVFICMAANAQTIKAIPDSIPTSITKAKKKKAVPDSGYNPNKAIVRSLILPGWGQVTNKKYWKVPIVYGALGTTGVLFFRNIRQYKDSRQAYILATDNDATNDNQIKQPYYSVKDYPERIRAFRNSVRQNVDYCVLFFIGFWGLNVADAAVDAHLKTFDVSDNLSLQLKAGYSPMAQNGGVQLVLNIGK